ncbi:uncharacterized protein LOC120887618 [Ictidomys tridecemlineatus]
MAGAPVPRSVRHCWSRAAVSEPWTAVCTQRPKPSPVAELPGADAQCPWSLQLRRARAGCRLGTERTPGGAASSSIYLLGQGHGPAASPLWGGRSAGGVSWRQAEQRSRAASSHSADADAAPPLLSLLRRPPPSPPPEHWRLRQPPLAPAPPGRLADSLPPPLLLPGTGTSRARAGVETPGPCARLGGGRRRQSRGTGASGGAG